MYLKTKDKFTVKSLTVPTEKMVANIPIFHIILYVFYFSFFVCLSLLEPFQNVCES